MIDAWLLAARATLADPRAGARWVLAQGLGPRTAAEALALTAVLGGILSVLTWRLVGDDVTDGALLALLFSRPLLVTALQMAVQFASAWAAWAVGRAFGGRGGLGGALALMAWAEAILLGLQALQLVLLVLAPLLAGILSPLTLILFFWLTTAFVTELHGFRRPLLVFAGILVTGVLMTLGVVVVLALLFGLGGLSDV